MCIFCRDTIVEAVHYTVTNDTTPVCTGPLLPDSSRLRCRCSLLLILKWHVLQSEDIM